MDIMTALSDIVSSIDSGKLKHYNKEHREIYSIALDQAAENVKGSKKWRKKLDAKYKLSQEDEEEEEVADVEEEEGELVESEA